MKNISIIGYGEIGQSLEKCYLGKKFNVSILDTNKKIDTITENIDILNICIPYTNEFITIVSSYIKRYTPELTIIHSTVIPETTRTIIKNTNNNNIIHSPVRGVHPNLYEGLKTFTKCIGGENERAVQLTCNHYDDIELKYEIYENSIATELAKILCTTYYGICIAFHNDIHNLCKKYNVSYDDVATKWNIAYNEGYTKLGMKNVVRPVLYPPKDGKIGGHCVVPNAKLCTEFFASKGLDYILELE